MQCEWADILGIRVEVPGLKMHMCSGTEQITLRRGGAGRWKVNMRKVIGKSRDNI